MVSSIGYALAKNSLISGFGRRHYHHVARGEGVGRRVAGAVVSKVGHAVVDKIANMISGTGRHRRVHRRLGGSYRLTGTGAHKRHRARKPRATLVHMLAPMAMGGYHRRRAPLRTLGLGYRRRAPRRTLGLGRRRRHHVLI